MVGPAQSVFSASALQLPPRCAAVLDESAASRLTQKGYYRWIFANDPERAEFR